MLSTTMRLKLLGLAAKNGVKIIDYSKGHVVASIATWKEHEAELLQFIEDLKATPTIKAIYFENAVVEIFYDHNALHDPDVIEEWIGIFSKYSFG